MTSKNTICLWYDGTALDAATFYAATFPDSTVGAFEAMMGMGKIDIAAIEAARLTVWRPARPLPPRLNVRMYRPRESATDEGHKRSLEKVR